MRSTRRERLARLGSGALVVLLAHSVCASRSAWAGCNHAVALQSARLLDINRLDALISDGASASVSAELAAGSKSESERTPSVPCSGPGCSSRGSLPLPTTSQGSDSSDQWLALQAVACLVLAGPPDHTRYEPGVRPIGRKLCIFHPPPA
jgi:hypothetical protein